MKTHRESRRSATLRFGVVGLPSYAVALLVLVFFAPAGLRAEPFDRAFHITPQLEALARRALQVNDVLDPARSTAFSPSPVGAALDLGLRLSIW